MVVFGEVGLGLLELVLLKSAAFAPFHAREVGCRHSSSRRGPPRLTRQSPIPIPILCLLRYFVVVLLATRWLMGAEDVVVDGCDGGGDSDVVVEMWEAVMAAVVVLMLDSWS